MINRKGFQCSVEFIIQTAQDYGMSQEKVTREFVNSIDSNDFYDRLEAFILNRRNNA